MQNSVKLLEQVRNYKPQSNVNSIREFIGGSVHIDFSNEIIARIEDMRNFNEECKSNEYLETRGGIKALRLTLNIFQDLVSNRESDLRMVEGDENG